MNRVKPLTALFLAVLIVFPTACWAEGEDDPLWNRPSYEKKVFTIGQRILAANGIKERIFFQVLNDTETVNAHAQHGRGHENTVTIYRGMLDYMDSDDELAAILGHEIAHILERHGRKNRGKRILVKTSTLAVGLPVAVAAGMFVPAAGLLLASATGATAKKAANRVGKGNETEADLVGVDLMVAAGYNPIAAETFMTKMTGDAPAWTNFWASHPLGNDRIDTIHQYISATYPQFVTDETASALPGAPFVLKTDNRESGERNGETRNSSTPTENTETASAALAVTDEEASGNASENPVLPAPEKVNRDLKASKTAAAPQKVAYAFKERPQVKTTESGSQTQAAKPSVAQQLLELNTDARLLIKSLSTEEYLEVTRLRDLFDGISWEA